jgi:hypothetical protein
MAKDEGEKGGKHSSVSDRQVRAHVLGVLKQLLPKGGEKRKGAGDQTIGWKEIVRAVGVSGGRCADAGGRGIHYAASS